MTVKEFKNYFDKKVVENGEAMAKSEFLEDILNYLTTGGIEMGDTSFKVCKINELVKDIDSRQVQTDLLFVPVTEEAVVLDDGIVVTVESTVDDLYADFAKFTDYKNLRIRKIEDADAHNFFLLFNMLHRRYEETNNLIFNEVIITDKHGNIINKEDIPWEDIRTIA